MFQGKLDAIAGMLDIAAIDVVHDIGLDRGTDTGNRQCSVFFITGAKQHDRIEVGTVAEQDAHGLPVEFFKGIIHGGILQPSAGSLPSGLLDSGTLHQSCRP